MRELTATVSLNLYHETLTPDEIGERLELEPTSYSRVGEKTYWHQGKKGERNRVNKHSYWSYSTEGKVEGSGRDINPHLAHLFDAIQNRRFEWDALLEAGWTPRAAIFWESPGHGGPALDHQLAGEMGELAIDLVIDVDFVDDADLATDEE